MEKEELKGLIGGIAKALGPGWSLDPEQEDWYWRGAIIGPAKKKLFISKDGKKLEASAFLPSRDKNGKYIYGIPKFPNIGFSAEKGAEKIAADIKKRLLPALDEALAKAEAIIADANWNIDAKENTSKRIAKALGKEVSETGSYHPDFDGGWGSIDVREGGEIKIELRSLNLEQAETIIAALNGLGGAKLKAAA